MKKILDILLLLVITINFSFAQSNSPIQEYINKYKEIAINEEIRTGVPASITLAQGILESGAGQSKLSISSNNHFGIKCKNDWKGATVYHDDDIKNECFRSYPCVEDSYRDHSDFLKSRPHYSFLFDLDVTDFEGWCKGLKKAGYATDPSYAYLLMKVIRENDLQQYTLMAVNRVNNWSDNIAITKAQPEMHTVTPNSVLDNSETVVEEGPVEFSNKFPDGIFKHNQLKCIYLKAGASLFALAKTQNLPYSKLLEYNDLNKKEDIIKEDKLIYLEKKLKKSNTKEYHIVLAGETLESISQSEGVSLESIIEYNKIQKGLQPQVGEKVYLQPGNPAYYPRLVRVTAH